MIDYEVAKWRLGLTWFVICGLLVLLVFVQMMLNKYGSRSEEFWSWLLPNFLPTLTLMATVFFADTPPSSAQRTVKKSIYRFALSISVFYLFLIILLILSEPLVHDLTGSTIFDVIDRTGFILSPIQGLASLALGYFFVKKK